jgi:branched-chain amino acid transport system substrate-binding protein
MQNDSELAGDSGLGLLDVREDGRLLHDFFLAEVKAPSESTAPWDHYKIRRSIPAQEAAQPLAQLKCALVRI